MRALRLIFTAVMAAGALELSTPVDAQPGGYWDYCRDNVGSRQQYWSANRGASRLRPHNDLMIGPGTRLRWNGRSVGRDTLLHEVDLTTRKSPPPFLIVAVAPGVSSRFLNAIDGIINSTGLCGQLE
jgi:hypothetical protein